MTYTVKNGTWCKDNNKEYYSTTKTGLKAALAAGEITAGTKVIIHEPQYHAGQLIQSLNPECPEGCFVPHGQAFDTSIYTELAKLFPDGNLPDMRECVMVCAGKNEHITTHEHDIFNVCEFKDDCAVKHSHLITVNDPGHAHDVNDPAHSHNIIDPGHTHNVTDPGHDHGRGTQNITGNTVTDSNAVSIDGAFSKGGGLDGQSSKGSGLGVSVAFDASKTWTGRSENVTTGISIDSDETGISVDTSMTGISVNDNTTGITAQCWPAGADDATVTRTKQFRVYYYVAF